MVGKFLSLLERDIANHPEKLQPINAELIKQLESLVEGIDIDIDARVPEDAEQSEASDRNGGD